MDKRAIAITGGIACGKSTVGQLLQQRGWHIVDLDSIAHRLLQPGAPNWQKVIDEFGISIINADQSINRRKLGDIVFGQPALLSKLNELTHPAIRDEWLSLEQTHHRNLPATPLAALIPLLFEVGWHSECARIICVACSAATQHQRLLERGLNPASLAQRLASQWPISRKMALSHQVVWNEGSLASLQLQTDRI